MHSFKQFYQPRGEDTTVTKNSLRELTFASLHVPWNVMSPKGMEGERVLGEASM